MERKEVHKREREKTRNCKNGNNLRFFCHDYPLEKFPRNNHKNKYIEIKYEYNKIKYNK